ncbi:MAG: hypothetical protein KDB05_19725 [Planctomycetales bacterium]|nr:hypothetical protein [Planctomycetales bacterium]
MKRSSPFLLLSLVSGLLTLPGCADKAPAPAASSQASQADSAKVDGSAFRLTSEPANARGVIQAREEASTDDDVVVVGRIGGSLTPWVEGRAAFSIVDVSLKSCAECGSDDCPNPWDYC